MFEPSLLVDSNLMFFFFVRSAISGCVRYTCAGACTPTCRRSNAHTLRDCMCVKPEQKLGFGFGNLVLPQSLDLGPFSP